MSPYNALTMRISSIFMTVCPLLSFRMNFSVLPGDLSNSTFTTIRPSGLGMSIFTMTFGAVSNLTALGILAKSRVRRKAQYVNTKSENSFARRPSTASSTSVFCSLDVEMMVQLAVLTVVSCVCWSPFLIHILVLQSNEASIRNSLKGPDRFLLLGLRMASWNQILDPWVYILLRRTVLFRICCGRSLTNL
ncbi:hypothetical protein WMY93_003771 [Mugilogobius chulae]|uniref:Uncharacterized protein n=1 Tax=Mugilogobius chulae TaxID=88201 RepID=A0AAW0Q5X6_9GOBI